MGDSELESQMDDFKIEEDSARERHSLEMDNEDQDEVSDAIL